MAAHDVRFHDRRGTEESRAAMALIHNELALHNRTDLQWNGEEKRVKWLERLEAALKAELGEVLQAPIQVPLGVDQPGSSFSKVIFDMPA